MEKNIRYNKIIGTGGIGKGMLFHSSEMRTLGRSESRLVHLSDAKDYCKQQIVLYYARALLEEEVNVYPIGYVGADSTGDKLIHEMEQDGMETGYIGQAECHPTMISVCIQYPDKEGCNITAINSAAVDVTPEYILENMKKIEVDRLSIVAAIPEVSVESRIAMLKYGKSKEAFCVLSVPAAEASIFLEKQAFTYCNLLAVNEEEARAILERDYEGEILAEELCRKLKQQNPDLILVITCGDKGAYSVVDFQVEHIPPFPGQIMNTTGAGDAFLGGMIAGLAMGMKIQKGRNDAFFGETRLTGAAELGAICAGMAIESKDSISREVTSENIMKRIEKEGWETAAWFTR